MHHGWEMYLYILDKDPTGYWEMELELRGSCKTQPEETCFVISADGQDLMAAEGSEVMEIKTFFKAQKKQGWRSHTQLLFTTALMPHATSMSMSSALQRKSSLRQDHTFPSTGTNIPLDSTTTADIKM